MILRLFLLCLTKASYTERSVGIGSQRVELKPGQFVTGRDSLAAEFNNGLKRKTDHVDARTIWRWIKWLESWDCLSCKSSNKYTLISIVNWAFYQTDDTQNVQQSVHVNVQQMSSKCPADVQQVSTNKKERKKETEEGKKDGIPYSAIIDYLNERCGTNFKSTTRATQDHIHARWREGFRLDDFIKVVDIKVSDWKGTEYEQYLRPLTLFGTKFESYLNSAASERRSETGRRTPDGDKPRDDRYNAFYKLFPDG